jgi:hypothetical protein
VWAAAADSNGGAGGDAPARAAVTRSAFGRSNRLPPFCRARCPPLSADAYECLRLSTRSRGSQRDVGRVSMQCRPDVGPMSVKSGRMSVFVGECRWFGPLPLLPTPPRARRGGRGAAAQVGGSFAIAVPRPSLARLYRQRPRMLTNVYVCSRGTGKGCCASAKADERV